NEHTVSACDEKLLGVQFFEKGDVSFYARLCPLPHDLRQLLFCLVVSWSGACYECENHQRKSGDDFCRYSECVHEFLLLKSACCRNCGWFATTKSMGKVF